jgi:hypothetical protein
MKVTTLIDVREFFDCDSSDYAESRYEEFTQDTELPVKDVVSRMLYELLDHEPSDGFAHYCDFTAAQVMTGDYSCVQDVQTELDDIMAEEYNAMDAISDNDFDGEYKEIKNPLTGKAKKVTEKDIECLKQWINIEASVWDSVGDSVGASDWASVGDFDGEYVDMI